MVIKNTIQTLYENGSMKNHKFEFFFKGTTTVAKLFVSGMVKSTAFARLLVGTNGPKIELAWALVRGSKQV